MAMAACSYAEVEGWLVIPLHWPTAAGCSCGRSDCTSPAKHPMTRHGLLDATKDVALIEQLWAECPLANIGIVTGEPSGVFVVDIDPRNGGDRAWQELLEEHGDVPVTRTVETGGGGTHLYFRHLPGRKLKKSIRRGIDLKGDGGYVVAPPSLHSSGGTYRWRDEAGIAEAPAWLVALATKPDPSTAAATAQWTARGQAYAVAALEREANEVASTPEGQRNDRLVQAAFRIGQLLDHLDAGEAEAALVAAGLRAGLPEYEARRTVASGVAAGKEKPRTIPEPQRESGSTRHNSQNPQNGAGGEAGGDFGDSEDFGSTSQNCEGADWEAPVSFDDFDLPSFPAEVLPAWLRSFVTELAIERQVPLELPGLLVLAVCGAAVARKVVVVVREAWQEPLNIWVLVVLPPGARKSQTISAATGPMVDLERLLFEQMAPTIEKVLSQRRILESQMHEMEKRASKTKNPAEAKQAALEAHDLAEQLAAIKVPAAPCLIVDDITPEVLATELCQQAGRIAAISAEGGLFEIMAGRYSNGTPNLDVFLKSHSGADELRVKRRGRNEYVHRPALTMALAIQPEVVASLITKKGFRGRGLLGRFFYAVPRNLVGQRQVNAPPMSEPTKILYRENLLHLLGLEARGADDEARPEHFLFLSEEARELHLRFERDIEPRLGEFGDLGSMTDWGAKLAGGLARLAAIICLARTLGDHLQPVSADDMAGAIAIGDYLISHARAAFGLMGADQAAEDAKYLLRWIKREGCSRFVHRDVQQATKGTLTTERLDKALAKLVDRGFIRKVEEPPRTGPGRPRGPTFDVSPACHKSPNPQNGGGHGE